MLVLNIKTASKEALLSTEALEALYHLLKYFISNITLEIREAHLRKKKLPQTMAAARGQKKRVSIIMAWTSCPIE